MLSCRYPQAVTALDLADVDAGAVIAGREADAVDLVAGALVVDERSGAELADGQEPRALEIVALAVACPAFSGDERCEREPGERVAGQEPFGGKVAVGVEVALVEVVDFALEQVERGPGLADLAPGPFLRGFGCADDLEDIVGGVQFALRFPVEPAPSFQCLLEAGRRVLDRPRRSSPRATTGRWSPLMSPAARRGPLPRPWSTLRC